MERMQSLGNDHHYEKRPGISTVTDVPYKMMMMMMMIYFEHICIVYVGLAEFPCQWYILHVLF